MKMEALLSEYRSVNRADGLLLSLLRKREKLALTPPKGRMRGGGDSKPAQSSQRSQIGGGTSQGQSRQSLGGGNGASGSGGGGGGGGSGGDDKDDPNRRKKCLMDKEASRADEDEKDENTQDGMDEKETVEAPVAKKAKGTPPVSSQGEIEEEIVRKKRLAKMDKCPPRENHTPAKTGNAFHSERKVKSPERATKQVLETPVAKSPPQTTPTKRDKPIRSPTQTLLSKLQRMDETEKTKYFLEKMLGYEVVFNESGSTAVSVSGNCLELREAAFTVSDTATLNQKLQTVILACLRKQQDPIRFCLVCYNNATDFELESDPLLHGLATTAKDIFIRMVLEQLIEGCQVSIIDDLWSGYSHSDSATTPVYSFLSRLSGWSGETGVPPEFLARFLQLAMEFNPGRKLFCCLVRNAASKIRSVDRPDDVILEAGVYFGALEILLSQPPILDVIGKELEREVIEAQKKMGVFFEEDSILSNLLMVSRFYEFHDASSIMRPPKKLMDCYTSLPGFPRATKNDVERLQEQIRAGVRKCQAITQAVLKKIMKTPNKANVLAWMASVVSLNELRTAAKFKQETVRHPVSCDGFMLNFCAVMLKFCQPFFASSATPMLAKINTSYCSLADARLDFSNEVCLARGCIQASDERIKKGHERFFVEGHNFLTECFFITQRALHVGLNASVVHFEKMLSELIKIQRSLDESRKAEIEKRVLLLVLSFGSFLFDPTFVDLCSRFYITQSAWLLMHLESCEREGLTESEVTEAQQELFSCVPEYCIKDMAAWFRFLANHQTDSLKSVSSSLLPFVECCVKLLERPNLLPGPLAQSRIVGVLLAFVDRSNRQMRSAGLLGPMGWGSGVADDLAAIVHTCPTVQDHLGPALLSTYAAVDVVEGLDVDKEDFDKYGSRSEITKLIEHFWLRQDCRSSILDQASTGRFQAFLSAIFDTLLYQLNDSMQRLAFVKQVQQSMEDEKTWNALPFMERERKKAFLRSEESVGSSFMRMATSTLGLLDLVTQSDEVAKRFSKAPLSLRAAAAIIDFIESLCGSRSVDFKVKDMSKYNFNPRGLLATITGIAVRFAKQSPSTSISSRDQSQWDFMEALASHPDYTDKTMKKALSILRRIDIGSEDSRQEFEQCLLRVEIMQAEMQGQGDGEEEETLDVDWQEEADANPMDRDMLSGIYIEALRESKYDSYDFEDRHAFHSHSLNRSLDPRSPKVRALMKEFSQLADSLPLHPDSSVFFRQDEDRMDMARALITGPIETPYSLGCFAFDIYYPSNYPNVPPLVKLITTGNGTVRFNPNLYADGKVCLSLLGTWHGGDSSEKWDPKKSSLFQVLVSIQGIILVPDPMYNEPGSEGMRGTAEGNARSRQCNTSIRLNTIRHAMVGQLRFPTAGFEDAIKVHFALQRDTLLWQCSQWLRECQDPDEEQRLRKAVDELRRELNKL